MNRIRVTLPSLEESLFFLLMLGLFMQRFYFEMVFAIKIFIILSVIILALFLRRIYQYSFRFTTYEKLFIVFSFYAIIRTFFAYDFDAGLRFILGYVFILIFYIVTRYLSEYMHPKTFTKYVYWTSLIFLVLSLFLYYYFDAYELDRGMYRLIGTIIDPNIFCLYAIIPFGYFIENIKKPKWWIIGLLSMFAVFLTSSRGGAIGLVVFILAYGFFYRSKIKWYHYALLIVLGIVGHFYMYANVTIYADFIQRFLDIFKEDISADAGSGRIGIWLNAINLWLKQPIFGIGLNNFKTLNFIYFHDAHEPHNTFLEILTETGIIGFALYMGIMVQLVLTKTNGKRHLILLKAIILSFLAQSFFLSNTLQEMMFFIFAVYTSFYIRGDQDEQQA